MKISEFLKQERQKRCLTQAEMAKKLGVSRANYTTYENSWVDKNGYKRIPSPTVIKKICKLTGCSAEYVHELIENERRAQMKNILLKSLLLTNYRNIENAKLEFDGDSKIIGENRIGKTNTLEAIYYLFTDKLLDGSSDISSIKPLNDTKREVRVCGVFDIDGKEVTIEKQYGEKWVKTRGCETPTMQGHYTNYIFDGVKQSTLKDYNKLFSEEFGVTNDQFSKIDFIQMLINPYYLGNLGESLLWTELRAFIIELVGDVSDDQVFAQNPKLSLVKEDIEKHNGRLDQIKKKYANEIDALKTTIAGKNSQIEMLEKTECPSEEQVAVATKSIEESERKINALSNKTVNNASVLIQEKINNKRAELNRLQIQDYLNERDNSKKAAIKKEIDSLQKEIDKDLEAKLEFSRELNKLENQIEDFNKSIEQSNQKRGELLTKLKQCDERLSNVDNQLEKVCPYCGSPIDEEKLEVQRQKLIEDINKEKQSLIAIGIEAKKEREAASVSIKNLEFKVNVIKEQQIKGCDLEIERLNSQIEAKKQELDECQEEFVKNPKIQELENQIAELEQERDKAKLDYANGVQNNEELIFQEKEAMKPFKKIVEDANYYSRQMEQAELIRKDKESKEKELANTEQKKELLNQFMYTKLKMLDNNVSRVFGKIKFQLIKENINGGFDAICKPYIYDIEKDASTDVSWKSGSKSERVVTGIAIVDCVKQRLNLPNLPFLFDEGGEISSDTFATKFKTESQLICVKIEDDIKTPIVAPIKR